MTSRALPSGAVPAKQKRPLGLLLMSLRTFIALFAVFAFFGLTTPNFLDLPTLVIIAQHVAINAIMAIGMTFVILTAGIDLSVGSIVGVSGMIVGLILTRGIPVPLFEVTIFPNVVEAMLIMLAAGAFIGLINGLLITWLNVAPFIATLGTLYIARGAALLISGGATFPNLVGDPRFGNTGYPFLGVGHNIGRSGFDPGARRFALAAAYLAARTPLGRHMFAVGGNERAAALSGIQHQPRQGVRLHVLGLLCGVRRPGGRVRAGGGPPGDRQNFRTQRHRRRGARRNLDVRAVAGRSAGSIIGAFVIGVLADGLVMIGVSSFWQMVIKGVVIIAAVVVDQGAAQLHRRVALQQMA